MTHQTENNRPLRGALIGFGNVAVHAHLPLWQESNHFRIEAVLEPDPERIQLAKALLPEARIYSEVEALLADNGLDFVDICTPPCFHADLALKACRSGLHVFCEKPLVTKLESLSEIQQAAEERGRVIFTVNNWKYAPLWMRVDELLRQTRIGTIRSISLRVLRPPGSGGGVSNWRRLAEVAGGGILLDHGWHHLYLILSAMKKLPLSISAKMGTSQTEDPDLEEVVDLVMRFETGEAWLHLSWRASFRQNFGTLQGDKGTLFINDDHLLLCANGLPPTRYDFAEALSKSSHHVEWMRPVRDNFHREILDPDARGVNLIESSRCARLIQLAYQSHREGSRFIDVDSLLG
jgi:predicted dehydrogenase